MLVTDNDHPSGYCQKCPSFSEAPYKNNANFYPHDTAAWNLAGSAGLMIHSGNDDIVKTCCNPLGSVAAWDASTRMALRATSCIDGTLSGRKYIHLGSICWYMDGCNSYTSTGKCKSCNDGYYLDDNQICRMCRAQCLEKPNELNITVAQALSGTCTDGRTWHRPCTKCRSADQCDECVRGYYLAKSSHFDK